MKFLNLCLLALLFVGCSSLKEVKPPVINDLGNRTIVVTLKEPKADVIRGLENQNQELVDQYKANLEQYNKAIKQVFENDWSFGDGVEIVKESNLDDYVNDRQYAILSTAAFTKQGEKGDFGYWIFVLERAENLQNIEDRKDFEEVDYHLSFPLAKTVGQQDEKGEFIPFTFDPFEQDGGISHYPGVKNQFGGNDAGYSKGDIVLTARLMENHLNDIVHNGFTGDFKDYIEHSYKKNCSNLKQQKMVVNPGQETTFYKAEAGLMFSSKNDMEDMYEEQNSKGKYDNHPYEVKVLRAPEIDELILNKEGSYNLMYWYPFSFNRKVRIVLNAAEGEVMAHGRYSSFTARVKGDLRNIKKCP